MQGHLKEITANLQQNLIAVCDVEENRVSESTKTIPEAMATLQSLDPTHRMQLLAMFRRP